MVLLKGLDNRLKTRKMKKKYIDCDFEIGMRLFQEGKFSQALKPFSRFKRQSKGIWGYITRIQIGICYMRLKKYDNAIREFTLLKRRKLSFDKQQTVDNFLNFCIKKSKMGEID